MFNELKKKNPSALNVIEEGDDSAKRALKEEVDSLLSELKRVIVVKQDKKTSEVLDQIHKDQQELRQKLDDKYADLTKQMMDDYETERLMTMRMFMQQELKIIKKDDRKIESYIPKLTRA